MRETGDGFSSIVSLPPMRQPGFATTRVTNEIIAAMGGLSFSEDVTDDFGRQPFVVKITGNETGGGKYTCKVYVAAASLCDPTANVTSSAIEQQELVGNAVFVNLQEVGTSGHWLTNAANTDQKYFSAHFYGHTSESPPRFVFTSNSIYVKACP